MSKIEVNITVNGAKHRLEVGPKERLIDTLRERLHPVSYTHLDVYKRQRFSRRRRSMSKIEVNITVNGAKHRLEVGPKERLIDTCLLYTSRCV